MDTSKYILLFALCGFAILFIQFLYTNVKTGDDTENRNDSSQPTIYTKIETFAAKMSGNEYMTSENETLYFKEEKDGLNFKGVEDVSCNDGDFLVHGFVQYTRPKDATDLSIKAVLKCMNVPNINLSNKELSAQQDGFKRSDYYVISGVGLSNDGKAVSKYTYPVSVPDSNIKDPVTDVAYIVRKMTHNGYELKEEYGKRIIVSVKDKKATHFLSEFVFYEQELECPDGYFPLRNEIPDDDTDAPDPSFHVDDITTYSGENGDFTRTKFVGTIKCGKFVKV
jgi:hypothetical protein